MGLVHQYPPLYKCFTSHCEECLWFSYVYLSICIIDIPLFVEEANHAQFHTLAVLVTVITSARIAKVRRWPRHLGFRSSGDQFVLLGDLGHCQIWFSHVVDIFQAKVVWQVHNVRKAVSEGKDSSGCFFVITCCLK